MIPEVKNEIDRFLNKITGIIARNDGAAPAAASSWWPSYARAAPASPPYRENHEAGLAASAPASPPYRENHEAGLAASAPAAPAARSWFFSRKKEPGAALAASGEGTLGGGRIRKSRRSNARFNTNKKSVKRRLKSRKLNRRNRYI